MTARQIKGISLIIAIAASSGCAPIRGNENIITGSAAGATSVNANKSLEHCLKPMGTLAVNNAQLTGSNNVTTIDPLIRLAVQQSNCFVITSIGNQTTEAILDRITEKQRNSGEIRKNSKQEKGQQVAADYLLDPQISIINNNKADTGNSNLESALVNIRQLTNAVSGNIESKSTDVALTLTDIRSRVQIAVSQGSATASSLNGSDTGAFNGWARFFEGGNLGIYSRTPDGVSTVAAFFEAYNNVVRSIRNYQAQEVEGEMGKGGRLKVKVN